MIMADSSEDLGLTPLQRTMLASVSHNDKTSVLDSDNHFIIDSITKTISSQGGKKEFGRGAHNSDVITFECDRYIEGHDMTFCNVIRIHYLNGNKPGTYDVNDMAVKSDDDAKATFTWTITSNVTASLGKIRFAIAFKCVQEDGSVSYCMPTKINEELNVFDTIDNSETVVQENFDILEQWKQDLFDASEREIGEAVAAYLTENPPSGATEEQAEQIQKNMNDIGELKEDITNLKLGVEPMWGDIPKIFFGGALQQTKDAAVVPFRYISKTADISGYAEIKAQGTSSMNYPKKNQTVKLFSDPECSEKLKIDFAGWGKQNKYCYKANWIDLSHARNVVSARLWADVVKSRSNYAELPEELRTSPNQGAIDGFPIKVYANGVYQGRYTLNIPKDKWAFNMDDVLDNHCVLCGENYVSGCFRAAANINGSDWTDEIHDVVPTAIKTRWNEVISFVMNSTDEEFKANLSDYFDVSSLIDYHLFGLQSCGLDAYGKNQLYMTYDGVKWIASMYDMDSTWGLYWDGSRFLATDYARTSYEDFVDGRSGNLLYIRLEQLFYTELKTRWLELKTGALSIDNIINRFERFTDIASQELVKEDFATTPGGGKCTCIPSQSTNNIQQIRAFALARQAWTDEYISALAPDLAPEYSLAEATTFDGVDDYVDTGIKLYDIAKDFTLLVEADLTQCITEMATVFHSIYEVEPWPGVNLYYSYGHYIVGGNANPGQPHYVSGCIDRVSYLNDGEVTTVNITDGAYNAYDGNLLLGCYQDTTGEKDRFWTGTISRFDVYFVALSDSKIETFLTE